MTRYGSVGAPVQGVRKQRRPEHDKTYNLGTLTRYLSRNVHYIGLFQDGDRFGIDDTTAVVIAPPGTYETLKHARKVRGATVKTLKDLARTVR